MNITFVIAAIDAKYKTKSTEIALADNSRSCAISGKAKSCTIKNVAKSYEVGATARSKNSKGFGAWSKRLSFIIGNGS